LNPQQKEVYDTLMKAIDDENGGLFFLDATGPWWNYEDILKI